MAREAVVAEKVPCGLRAEIDGKRPKIEKKENSGIQPAPAFRVVDRRIGWKIENGDLRAAG